MKHNLAALTLAGIAFFVSNGRLQAQGGSPCDLAPEIIYHNGVFLTMDDDYPMAAAMAVRADTIMAVGASDDILSLQADGCSTLIADLHGLTVLPGFNESHGHWFSWPEHICSVSAETTYPSLEEIMDMLSANGWTSFSELNFGRPDYAPAHLENALDLDSRGKLSVRLNGYWGTFDDPSMIDVLTNAGRARDTYYSERVRAPGVKMYVDNPFGEFDLFSQEETNALVAKAHAAGWQIAAHAVNESGVEKILTAYENVLGAASNAAARHRIEHAVKVTDDQLSRMKAKGIIASFQLLGPADWPTQSDFGDRFLGDHSEWVMRWKDFVDAQADGLKITGSTDAPFNDAPCNYSPFEFIYQAVTRDGYSERVPADWELGQRITVQDALELFTIDGAYATSEESMKGSLTPGKWADFVIVSENPLTVSIPEDLRSIEVLATFVGGGIEYCDEAAIGDVCSPTQIFTTETGIVSASAFLADQTPDHAFDDDVNTNWGAGDFPPQWIQVDLGEPVKIAGIDLVVDQFPAGRTVHEIWAKADPDAEFELLHRFGQDTQTDQVLTYDAPSDISAYQIFQVKSVLSLSWTSWKEITIRNASVTSADDDATGLPNGFALDQNYPNPFNPNTTIRYDVPEPAEVRITVFDALGRAVKSLVSGQESAGRHSVTWNARTEPSGIYYVRMEARDFIETRMVTLLK